ncbi:MAG: cation-translocating P-type ATPase [Planctomycetes bacterium]|nr:cation-translocating P-type ATPase [Planctomycetota bacterium]
MNEVTFSITGMSCGTCADRVADALRALEGVHAVDVSYVLARAAVRHDPGVIQAAVVRKAIEKLGFTAAETPEDATAEASRVGRLRIASTIIVGLLLGVAWAARFFGWGPSWLTGALAGFAVVLGGYSIASRAIRAALHRQLSVDALVTIAALAAVAIGNYLEAGVVVFILLLGELLEEITVFKTSKAIRGLASLLPDTVTVKRGETEAEVGISEVAIGDIVVVRSGERIAVDGDVVAGNAIVDQSPITGESLPVKKAPGDEIYSGTINQIGAIEIRATKVGKETTVAKIKAMIAEAQGKKSAVQRQADRFAAYFVPAMLVIAIAVYFVTGDIQRAITILIVACPCALVLGTPTAVVAAIGAAARHGIVIRGGDVLETLGRVNGVVFDKTGTLTCGAPRVTDIKSICGHPPNDVLRFAAVAEKLSEHPLASAILDKAREWDLLISAPEDFQVQRGRGVEVKHDGLRIILGNRSLLTENAIALSPEAEAYMQNRESLGDTTLIVAHDKEICGLIALADPIREQAPETIRNLRASGVHRIIAMYTGDNHRTASSIARSLGIEEVAAGLLPQDKANRIKALSNNGHVVAMVGDGINDAPALATADVGIAMGMIGSDIAAQAANVTLLTDDLWHVPAALALGRKALAVIRQNIAFAMLFNTTMILLASGGIVCMVVGAVCHQASSLFVILNSMRLLLAMKRRPVPGEPR